MGKYFLKFDKIFQVLVGLALFLWIVVGPLNQGNFLFFIALMVAIKIERDYPSAVGARNFRNLFLALLFSFAVINFLSVLMATDAPGMSFPNRNNDYIYGLTIAAALGLGLRNMRDINRMLLVMMVLFGVFYTAELLTLPFRSPYEDGRFIGIMEYNANVMAMNLLMMFSIYFASLFRVKDRLFTLLCAAAASVMCVLLFLTKTRFALLTMVFVTVPTSMILQRRFGRVKMRLVAAILIVFIIAPAGSYYWWQAADADRKSFANVDSRINSWRGSLKIAGESEAYRLIIGNGNMWEVYLKLHEHYKIDDKYQKNIVHTHNVLVQTFLESGILGVLNLVLIWILAWLGVFAVWVRDSPEGLGLEIPLLTSLTTIAVFGQMDYALWTINGKLAWFLLGLSYAFIQVNIRGNFVSQKIDQNSSNS
jgi:O-antigen ligase